MTGHDVFISYKREERALAKSVLDALTELGLSVWIDDRLDVGEPFETPLVEALKSAKAVIVCWSPWACESEWVLREAQYAADEGKLCPVAVATLNRTALPARFRAIGFADLSAWGGELNHIEWEKLLRCLSSRVGHSPDALVARSREVHLGKTLSSRLRNYLVNRARVGSTEAIATYQEAASELGISPDALHTLFAALDETASVNRARREPLLCALVVNKDTGLPGKGFFQKHAFLPGPDHPLAVCLWRFYVDQVVAYAWPDE